MKARRHPWTRFVLWRLAQGVLVVFLTFTASFALLTALPGDAIAQRFDADGGMFSEEERAKITAYYGYDQPIVARYLQMLGSFLTGDLGYSIARGTPVLDDIGRALPNTLQLAGPALLIAILVTGAIALGANRARVRGVRDVLFALPSLLAAIPAFWLGIALILVFSFQLGWIPVLQRGNDFVPVILPSITLGLLIAAPTSQILTRGVEREVGAFYFTATLARGASFGRALTRDALGNAALPALTLLGLIVGEVLSGSIVVETVYSRPGLGTLTRNAIEGQDLPVLQAIVVLSAVVFVAINIAVDIAGVALDPKQGSELRARASAHPRRAEAAR